MKGKVAIVTGSGSGIGRSIAIRLAQEGATVVVNDINQETVSESEQDIRSKGAQVLGVLADVTNSTDVTRMFEQTIKAFGTVDTLVNNAAWADPVAHFLDMTEAFWDRVITTNLKSMFLCSQMAARLMAEQKKRGAIVNISSWGALRAHREMVAYDASKGGVEAATRAMALDLAPWGIRVNAVGPGPIATPRLLGLFRDNEKIERLRQTIPLERLGQPPDVAAAVLFLASDDASFITGQILYVDGGALAQLRPSSFERHQMRPVNR